MKPADIQTNNILLEPPPVQRCALDYATLQWLAPQNWTLPYGTIKLKYYFRPRYSAPKYARGAN